MDTAELATISALASGICGTTVTLTAFISTDKDQCTVYGEIESQAQNALASFSTDVFLVILELGKNERFHDHPLVTGKAGISFYTGIPLTDSSGVASGTLCIWSKTAPSLGSLQLNALKALGQQAALLVEQKKTTVGLSAKVAALKNANADLDSFATMAAHDLKSPLNAIISLTHLIKDNYATTLDEEGNEYINFLSDAATNLTHLVTGILNYSRSTQALSDQKEQVNFTDLIEEVTGFMEIAANVSISYEKCDRTINVVPVVLKQILLNLLDNAIMHNDKSQVSIVVTLNEDEIAYSISVADNGPGIDALHQEKIFDLFKKSGKKTKDTTMRIGLAIVKKLAEKIGGNVKVSSVLSEGATFTVVLPK